MINLKFHTFGCKVNTYDTGLLEKRFSQHVQAAANQSIFAKNQAESGMVHILNTCAVTQEASREATKLARRIKSKDPFAKVIVTGCAAQVDHEMFSSLSAVDLVVANSHKTELPSLAERLLKGLDLPKVHRGNIFRKEDLEPGGGLEENHTRSFLKIQDGCNSFCSFCIIPYARGKSRSLSIRDLVARVQHLNSQNVSEVVLTGVHIGDYEDPTFSGVGGDSGKLEDLLEQILLQTKIARIRLTSLEPIEVSDRLLALYKDSRMCPHFHMSIQSANTRVLKAMKRKYGQEEVSESLNRIHALIPGAYVGMDVIAGFPTETEEEFLDTYRCLDSLPWTRLHVFPYSERPGTRADQMEQLPLNVRKQRARRLRELSLDRWQRESLKQIGQAKKVVLLKSPENEWIGLSRDYWKVHAPRQKDSALLTGQEVEVKILGVKEVSAQKIESSLFGEIST